MVNRYPAVHEYVIKLEGREKPRRIGKVLLGPGGTRIFYRRELFGDAYMRNMGSLSIDERALAQWELDKVDVIHFADKSSSYLWAISRADFLEHCWPADNGEGRQMYVSILRFLPRDQLYHAGYTKNEITLPEVAHV